MIGHLSPEAATGGPLALVEDGDVIAIDVLSQSIDLRVAPEEMKRRAAVWQPPRLPLTLTRGVLNKYSRNVSSAHYGALTDGSHSEVYEKRWEYA